MRWRGRIFTILTAGSCVTVVLLVLLSAFPAFAAPSPVDPVDSGENRRMLALPGDLIIESVTCAFDSVVLEQEGIPVTIRIGNSSNTSITVRLLQLIFSENSTGDRNDDYEISGDVAPEVTIPAGGNHDFELSVMVNKDAITDMNIRIDAYAPWPWS